MSLKQLIGPLAAFVTAIAAMTPTTVDDMVAKLLTAAANNADLLNWLDSLLNHSPTANMTLKAHAAGIMTPDVASSLAGAGIDDIKLLAVIEELVADVKAFIAQLKKLLGR